MLVSVIMPTYNCGKFILQSLDSVIAQTVTDWEVQIVDDCSTDNTAEVLKPKNDNGSAYLLLRHGLGLCGNLRVFSRSRLAQFGLG